MDVFKINRSRDCKECGMDPAYSYFIITINIHPW